HQRKELGRAARFAWAPRERRDVANEEALQARSPLRALGAEPGCRPKYRTEVPALRKRMASGAPKSKQCGLTVAIVACSLACYPKGGPMPRTLQVGSVLLLLLLAAGSASGGGGKDHKDAGTDDPDGGVNPNSCPVGGCGGVCTPGDTLDCALANGC